MVRLLLSIKAELENVTNLVPASDSFEYFFQVAESLGGGAIPIELSPRTIHCLTTVNLSNEQEERDVSGGKGATAHFVWRCGMCKRESSAKFEATKPLPYADENGQFAPLLTIECRGLEFVGFDPRGIWQCEGLTGAKFPEVDLENGEWVDYDEKVNFFPVYWYITKILTVHQAALPVGVSGLESQWSRAP
ncbi:hypothetical protein CCMSSC00406_0004630 [Pleurotus cornucopiae]|uniref:Uncharacterized protein n=1 Tax=Pleurotus cornucopiae TaxID=5321 RepID=A0ACB7IXU5_PLECO|nr:hypothetical protein CCMSSC00406_0004630 [Pleurotus cornucopiae]